MQSRIGRNPAWTRGLRSQETRIVGWAKSSAMPRPPWASRGNDFVHASRALRTRCQPYLAAEQTLAGVEIFLWVDGFAFDANFVVQVRPGRATGRAEPADDRASAHGVADIDVDLG